MKTSILSRILRTAFLIVVVQLIFVACENEKNDVIPDVYINFIMDLHDPEFLSLSGIGGSVYISASTNNYGPSAAGYNGNGLIVHCGPDAYYAYDRTCPHDFAVNGQSVRVNIDFMLAVCPVCSTKYALSAGGTPAEGIGQYPLKNYRTSFDGRFITVWN
jgi:nitrite reductase/ring-hydroxylating ferredoxin subunit